MSGPAVFAAPRDLIGQEGQQFGPTDWLTIEQDRIDGFAEVTGDHQWIHVDTERAKDGPFGKTIAHGYLTLSLANYFLPQLVEVRGFAHAVNVGADRLRFLAPVPVGSRSSVDRAHHDRDRRQRQAGLRRRYDQPLFPGVEPRC